MGFGCLRLTSGQLENRQKNGENHKTDVECQHFCLTSPRLPQHQSVCMCAQCLIEANFADCMNSFIIYIGIYKFTNQVLLNFPTKNLKRTQNLWF